MKQNKKLKNKFFELFRVFYVVGKTAYKLDLPTKWKVHNLFYVSLLEQDTMRKRRVDKALLEPENKLEFKTGGNKKYGVQAIINSAVYGQKTNNQIPSLYYLVLWKDYPKEENTWEPSSAIIILRKFINTLSGEADSDLSTLGLRSTCRQANNPETRAKTKAWPP